MYLQLAKLTEQLGLMFDEYNNIKFEGKLPKPIITIQSTSKEDCYGWCSIGHRWINDTTQEKYYEINLSAEHIHRSYLHVAETLYHEMIHLYNQENYIIDCARNGKHLKRYKGTCDIFGLNCEKDNSGSWTVTSFTNELKKLTEEFDIDKNVFVVRRTSSLKPAKLKKETEKPIKMQCECGNKITCKVPINATCNDCNSKFTII